MRAWWRQSAALVRARSTELVRERTTLWWNILFPALMIVAFVYAFSSDNTRFRVAVHSELDQLSGGVHAFLQTRFVQSRRVDDLDAALQKLRRHEWDMVVNIDQAEFWVNENSGNGYVLERLLEQSFGSSGVRLERRSLQGPRLRYVDWALPGVLAMNLMFSGLWGVGFVLVRYRKNGVLKRIAATPVSAFQFLLAQLLSRLWLMVAITVVVYTALHWVFEFAMRGSYLLLLALCVLGATTMIALGLVLAARTHSEEFGSGVVNVLSWPMLLLSEVWFSLAGAAAPLQWLSQLSPLAHLVRAARAIMLDGAGLMQLWGHFAYLGGVTALCLALSAWRFRWT